MRVVFMAELVDMGADGLQVCFQEVCLLLLAFGRGVGSIGSQRHFGVDNHFPFVGVFHDDVGLHLLPAFLVDDGFAPFVF